MSGGHASPEVSRGGQKGNFAMEKPREPSEVANEGRDRTQGSSDFERLKATLDALDEGFFEVDLDGRFLASNRAMERLLGIPEGGLLNRDYRDVLAPESAASLHAVFRKVYLTGASLKLATLEVTRADGIETLPADFRPSQPRFHR